MRRILTILVLLGLLGSFDACNDPSSLAVPHDTVYVEIDKYIYDTAYVDTVRYLYDTAYVQVHDTSFVNKIEQVYYGLYYDIVKHVYDTVFLDTSRKRPDSTFAWPKSASAAVSLSYDDGYSNNLDQAIPDLEAQGFLGTFYVYMNSFEMQARKYEWKGAFERGHEIGNHSWYHPCRRDQFKPEDSVYLPYILEDYSPEEIMDELARSASWLTLNIGHDPYRTYAHPCVATEIGDPKDEYSYDQAVAKYHYGARVGGSRFNDPLTVNYYRIQSYISYRVPLDSLISYCEQAKPVNGWTVIMFHGIGGPGLETDRKLHQDFLEYLAEQDYWVAPVRDVLRYICEDSDSTQ